MMGSVAGVGQFLETVGVPGPQVGTQTGADNSTPGHDFASALQQAGGPAQHGLAAPVSGQQDADGSAKSNDPADTKSATGAAGAQTATVKAGAEKSSTTAPAVNRTAVGQPLSSLGRALGIAATPANLVGSKQTQTAALEPAETTGAGEIAPADIAPDQGERSAMSLSGTAKVEPAAASVSNPANNTPVVAQALAVAGTSHNGAASLKATAKTGEAPKGEIAKPSLKADASPAVDSKLIAVVTQSADLTAAAAPLPVSAAPVASVVPDAPSSSSTAVVKALTIDTPAATAPSTAPARVTAAQPGLGKQFKKDGTDQKDDAASVGTVAPASLPASRTAASGGTEAPAVLPNVIQVPAAGSETSSAPSALSAKTIAGAPQGGAAAVPGVPAAPVPAVQVAASPTVAATAASPEQANAGFQGALQTAALVEAITPKPGLQTGRTAVPGVKTAADTIASGSVNAIAAPAVASATAPMASVVPVPVPTQSAATAHSAASPKASLKTGEQTVPLQAAPPSAKVPAEALSTPETPAKISTQAVHAVAAAQPVPAPVEPLTGGPAVAASVPLPVVHEAGAGTTNVGTVSGLAGPAGMVAGTQDAGGVAGLSHTTLSSSPTSLEVGVASGTHGWLKIRAELNATGEVNASLTGATPAAAEKLRGEMPALSNYLQSERVAMGTLDVRSALHTAAAVGESSATFSQAGSGQGSPHPGSGQPNTAGAAVSADAGSAGSRAQQQTPRGTDVVPVVGGTGDEVVPGRLSDAALYTNSIELGDNAGPSPVGYGAGGGWLNVRA